MSDVLKTSSCAEGTCTSRRDATQCSRLKGCLSTFLGFRQHELETVDSNTFDQLVLLPGRGAHTITDALVSNITILFDPPDTDIR